ncbi:MAG: S8 family serine peptidase [Planctomycetota bacterium]|jgi:hypothetical protein
MHKKCLINKLVHLIIIQILFLLALPLFADINDKIAQLDIDKAGLDDVISVFGEPIGFIWGKEAFTKNNLPDTYIARYPNGFCVVIRRGIVNELRFEQQDIGYLYKDKLKVGSSVNKVLDVLGKPKEEIKGKANDWKEDVLYRDIDGKKGYCYYNPSDENVRFFFWNNKISALYVTSKSSSGGGSSQRTKPRKSVKSILSKIGVKPYDDVRAKDMSKLDLSRDKRLIHSLTFNKKTVWPEQEKMPTGGDPNKILSDAMNPGLGIRQLHKQGITGKGVNVAIIDQPMFLDHPEYDGKVTAYYDTGCDTEKSSMHGPAVTSLLVGINCGTAPEAKVYYAAAPSWKKDASYYAKGLHWIIEQNKKLPISEKIRVVSVSAAPSGPGSPFDKNNHMWDTACAQAEAEGIMILDCTRSNRGFISRCWYDIRDPDNVNKCTPGAPGQNRWFDPSDILVPASVRTTAQHYDYHGRNSYIYWGQGGLSWAIPYCAGVMAMGWQIKPELTGEEMKKLLFETAYTNKDGAKVINPVRFIEHLSKL